MQIIGIGTDIVKKARIKKIFNSFNEKFAAKILTPYEITQYKIAKNKISYLAKRFAAKEAIAKALGTGINGTVSLSEIEIYNNDLGKPEMRLLGATQIFANTLGVSSSHLTIADEKEFAIAFAILEKKS